MLDSSSNCNSRSRWSRRSNLLLVIGLAISCFGLLIPRTSAAQTPDAETGSQTASQQADQPQEGQPDHGSNQYSDQASGMHTGQTGGQLSGGAAGQETMSAEQIIGILEQEPEILDSFRNLVAQQTGVDPTSIGDETLFERIRQNLSLRVLATGELTRRGYALDVTMLNVNPRAA